MDKVLGNSLNWMFEVPKGKEGKDAVPKIDQIAALFTEKWKLGKWQSCRHETGTWEYQQILR